MAQAPLTFIHHNGRIIPIRAQDPAGEKKPGIVDQHKKVAKAAVAATSSVVHKAKVHVEAGLDAIGIHTQPVQVNKKLDALGLGLSVASGVVAAATLSKGAKVFGAGLIGSHGLDALGITANVASVAGKGRRSERVKQAGKQEARNFIVGNTIFAAGALGIKKNRTAIGNAIKSTTSAVLRFGRRVVA